MFVDAVEFCKKYPNVKRINEIQLDLIKVGNEIQLRSLGEEIWITVESIDTQTDCNNHFTGKVIYEPVFDQLFNQGDIVNFETRHIFNVRLEYELF